MKNISLSVDDMTIERMKERAEELGMTYSAYVRWLVRLDYLDAKRYEAVLKTRNATITEAE